MDIDLIVPNLCRLQSLRPMNTAKSLLFNVQLMSQHGHSRCTIRKVLREKPDVLPVGDGAAVITAALVMARRRRQRDVVAYLLPAFALADALLYFFDLDAEVRSAAFAFAGVSCLVGVALGLWRLNATDRRPWWWIFAAAGLFLGGSVSRSLSLHGEFSAVPDILSVLGYVAACVALLSWLRSSSSVRTWSLSDAMLVAVGASLAAWALLLVPTLGISSVSGPRRAMYALYPVLDVVLLLLMVRLALLRFTRFPAFWLFLSSLTLILLGDVQYAVSITLSSNERLVGGWPLTDYADALYILAFGFMGAAVLHPSAERLSRPQPGRIGSWSRGRLAGVGVALLAPSLLLLLVPAQTMLDRVVRAVLAAALTAIVLHRTAQAINGYARSEQLAHHRAGHDELTGLPNRLALNEVMRVELATGNQRGERVSLLFLDLDGFKLINDSYGHGVGDELLIAAAVRVREAVREDDFVARLGGDEFVVVSRHLDAASGEGLADRLLVAFADPFQLSTGPVFVSPSIGIARSTGATGGGVVDGETLLRDADAAMYKAKAAGRNRAAVFDESLREASRQRIEHETGLRNALDQQHFELHYQPVVRMTDGTTLGYEALLRWRHPEKGMIGPADFIAVAEDTWLIVPIGAWVLNEALRQVRVWREDDPSVYVAVNVSARQMRDANFPSTVADALVAAGLPGDALCLELTEYALVDDTPVTEIALTAIRALGVSIAVDDFGTGYSALGYLKRLPVSTVKIDKSFVDGLGTSRDDEALVRAILAMAHALGLGVIAEGVETAVQAHALRAMGCKVAQGWLYGRPQPAPAAVPVGIVNAMAVGAVGGVGASREVAGQQRVLLQAD